MFGHPRTLNSLLWTREHSPQRRGLSLSKSGERGQWASTVARWQRICPPKQETQETRAPPLGQEDPLEEGMATHSSILTWRIPWTEEPGGLRWQSWSRPKRLSTRAGQQMAQWLSLLSLSFQGNHSKASRCAHESYLFLALLFRDQVTAGQLQPSRPLLTELTGCCGPRTLGPPRSQVPSSGSFQATRGQAGDPARHSNLGLQQLRIRPPLKSKEGKALERVSSENTVSSSENFQLHPRCRPWFCTWSGLPKVRGGRFCSS